MKLNLNELESIVNQLLIYLQQHVEPCITFRDADLYYQKVWHNDRDFRTTPEIAIGSLQADITALKKLLSKEEEPLTYDLERLGSVFYAIASQLSQKKDAGDTELHISNNNSHDSITLNLDELANITSLLLHYTTNLCGDAVSMAQIDVPYQTVVHQDLRVAAKSIVVTGFLDEDLSSLKELIGGRPPSAVDFEHIGAVLTTLGATML